MSKLLRLFVLLLVIGAVAAVKSKTKKGRKANDVPKRVQAVKSESTINFQLVRARSVEIGFSFIQGAEGFIVTAKEWIDGSYEQSVATDRQIINVQRRSAVLRNLIPGREYLIQVQALSKINKAFGPIQADIVRTAQMCYVCNGVGANEECNSDGDAVECPHDKDACINVVRFDNTKMSITKRCAQYSAQLVEKVADSSSQSCAGGEKIKDSVCKCMCRSNLCNNQMLPCVDECLDELPTPLRSSLKCTNGRRVGSVCKWSCEDGYILKGLRDSKCRKDRTWSVMSPPQCIRKVEPRRPRTSILPIRRTTPTRRTSPTTTRPREIKCRPFPRNTKTDISCTNGRKQNSVCTVTCKDGFAKEAGSTVRVCKNAKWTGTPIVCKEILCPSVTSISGSVNCSDSRKVGSVCNVPTSSTVTCQKDGSWLSSNTCGEIGMYDAKSTFGDCEPLPSPAFGAVKCSDESKAGSVCKYFCANGYSMVGETQLRRCQKGQWTGSPVTCEERRCGDLKLESFVKGVIKCSDDNKIGSVCDVMTPSTVTCQADGSWSMPFKQAPKCKECSCP